MQISYVKEKQSMVCRADLASKTIVRNIAPSFQFLIFCTDVSAVETEQSFAQIKSNVIYLIHAFLRLLDMLIGKQLDSHRSGALVFPRCQLHPINT